MILNLLNKYDYQEFMHQGSAYSKKYGACNRQWKAMIWKQRHAPMAAALIFILSYIKASRKRLSGAYPHEWKREKMRTVIWQEAPSYLAKAGNKLVCIHYMMSYEHVDLCYIYWRDRQVVKYIFFPFKQILNMYAFGISLVNLFGHGIRFHVHILCQQTSLWQIVSFSHTTKWAFMSVQWSWTYAISRFPWVVGMAC